MENRILDVPEIVSCGVFDSRLSFGNRTETKNRKVSIYELELPLDNMGVCYINGEALPLDDSLVICSKPGQIRHSKLPFRAYFIHLLVRDNYTKSVLNQLPNYFRPTQRRSFEAVFSSIIYAYESASTQNALLCHAKIFELLSMLVQETAHLRRNTHLNAAGEAVIEAAIDYMDAHFLENIDLQDVADHVHLTKIYFHTLFKAATGVTTHQYMLSKKMEEAKKQLVTHASIADAAAACGFNAQSYFNYVFKRETGMTPKQYKQRLSQDYPTP